jgi:hypothetical protein
MPSASTSRLRLAPCLARSVGFFPVFFPPEGRLGHAPVHRQPGPVDAFPVVVGHQARLPHLLEDAGLHPLLEAVVGRGAGAKFRGVQGLPLAAGAEDEEDGLHADPVGLAGPAAAEAVGVGVLGQQDGDGLPQVVGKAPLFRDGSIVHD